MFQAPASHESKDEQSQSKPKGLCKREGFCREGAQEMEQAEGGSLQARPHFREEALWLQGASQGMPPLGLDSGFQQVSERRKEEERGEDLHRQEHFQVLGNYSLRAKPSVFLVSFRFLCKGASMLLLPGVFAASTLVAQGPVSCRAISDLANQIAHSVSYRALRKELNLPVPRCLSVAAGEWFSGLPTGWTSTAAGDVDPNQIISMFPCDLKACQAADQSRKLGAVSLFTGVAGLELGVSQFFEAKEMVEWDCHCRAVLAARQQEGREAVAVLAGFPCQDVSAAGLQKGLKGKRSSLIKRVFDVYDQLPQGRVLFLENVGALLSRNSNCRNLWNYVHKECDARGLQCFWTSLTLRNVGLPAGRARVFMLACKPGEIVFQASSAPCVRWGGAEPWNPAGSVPDSAFLSGSQSPADRARLRCMGNTVVPRQAYEAACILRELQLAAKAARN
ncbi:unnamed protein product [Effrenium voratum]|nr:unnamed protein product [Effrenium voratum]